MTLLSKQHVSSSTISYFQASLWKKTEVNLTRISLAASDLLSATTLFSLLFLFFSRLALTVRLFSYR